jgi:hypothetical protein
MDRTHDGRHGDDCFGCRIQTVRLSTSCTPSRNNDAAPATANPAWEKGVVGEHRRDGSFMPYIENHTMNAIHVKEFAENRRHYESELRRANAAT